MKRILSTIFIGLLCLSMFPMFAPKAKADSEYLTDIVQLTTNPYRDWQPIWSKDGSKIVYFAYDNDWDRHIWVMNADGTGKIQLTFGNVLDESGDFSPDGEEIVFIRYAIDRGIDGFDLWTMNSDGSNLQRLTSTGLHHGLPRWSYDGQKLAFYYGGAGTNTNEIHIMNADGTNEVTVVSSSYSGMSASWSRDDRKLAYTMDDGIWLVNTFPPYDKTHLYQTSLPANQVAFSPDGKYILYSSGVLGQPQDLYLIDSNGNFVAQLTNDAKIGYPFDWSPDGQYIAFGSLKSGNADVWRARIVIEGAGARSPVGYWKFDEGSGSVAHDSSASGNDGAITGAEWVQGVSGSALRFRDSGTYMWAGFPNGLAGNHEFTVSFWIKIITWPTAPYAYVILMGAYHWEGGEGARSFHVLLDNDPGGGAPRGTVRANFLYEVVPTAHTFSIDMWYNWAFVYDRTSVKMYQNGAFLEDISLGGAIPNLDASGATLLSQTVEQFFNGILDEVAIYDYARTAEEILNDYASASGLKRILIVNNAGTFGETWYLPDGTPFTLMSFLRDKGFLVDVWTDISNGRALSLDILPSYDVAILPSWFFDVQDNLQYQNALLDYVNQGGGLLFAGQSGFAQTLDGSLGFKYVDGSFVDASIVDSSHPIMQGISELPKAGGVFVDWDNVIAETPLPSNVAILARTTDPSNRIALIAFQHENGRVVAGPSDGLLRPYGPTGVDSWSPTSQPVTENELLINAINWVSSATQPDFEISVSPKTDDVADPHSQTEFVVTVKSINGFNEPVTLSAVYSSHELSGSFGDTVVTPPSDGSMTTTLAVSVLSEAINTHQIYVTGTSGTLTHTKTASLHLPFMSVPYLSQGDTKWCIPASLVMTMDFWGKNLKPWDAANTFGLGHDDGLQWSPNNVTLVENYISAYGLGYIALDDITEDGLKNLLGYGPVFLPVHLEYGGHAVVVTGYLEHDFYINNPAGEFQIRVPWSTLLGTVGFSYVPDAIAVTGVSIQVPKGVLNLVGGKDEGCRTIRTFHETVPGPYIWESGARPLGHETAELTWQFGSHQRNLDPLDQFIIAQELTDGYDGLIVNPTGQAMHYELQVVFESANYELTILNYVDVGPCEVKSPLIPPLVLGEYLGKHYGEYTISLKLLGGESSLLDQIVLPRIRYSPGLKMSVHSPANLFVTDSQGRSIGTNPDTGQVVNQIPDAFYSGPSTEPQVIMIPDPIDGTYNIILVGTATGSYALTIEYITAEQTLTQTFNGAISQQEKQYYSAIISETGEMQTISWEHVFKDPKRGTMLKISTDDKYFQFIAPDKDFGIKHDPKMIVYKNIIGICYRDTEMSIVAAAIVSPTKTCVATVLDKSTRRTHLLVSATCRSPTPI